MKHQLNEIRKGTNRLQRENTDASRRKSITSGKKAK